MKDKVETLRAISRNLDELPAYLVALAADLTAGDPLTEGECMALWHCLYDLPTPTAVETA